MCIYSHFILACTKIFFITFVISSTKIYVIYQYSHVLLPLLSWWMIRWSIFSSKIEVLKIAQNLNDHVRLGGTIPTQLASLKTKLVWGRYHVLFSFPNKGFFEGKKVQSLHSQQSIILMWQVTGQVKVVQWPVRFLQVVHCGWSVVWWFGSFSLVGGWTNEEETCGKPKGHHVSLPKGWTYRCALPKFYGQVGRVEPATSPALTPRLTVTPSPKFLTYNSFHLYLLR